MPREQAGSFPPPAVTHRFPISRRGDAAQGGSGHNTVPEYSPRVHPDRQRASACVGDAGRKVRPRIDMTFKQLGLNARMVSSLDALSEIPETTEDKG